MQNVNPLIRYLFLYPASLLYGLIVFVRNRLYDYKMLKSKEFPFPVISVGNITVGGTGKTPHAEYLISKLQDDFNLALLSRGYKRNTKGFRFVSTEDSYKLVGDEPAQIKNKFPDITVAVDENRVHGIKHLKEQSPKAPDVIILDDAFQHRKLKPGLSILLVDYNQPMFHDHLLPYGRLRENRHEKRRANIIIITKTPKKLKPIERRILFKNLRLFPYQTLYFTRLKYGSLRPVSAGFTEQDVLNCLSGNDLQVLIVSGIARPEDLIHYVKTEICSTVESLTFPDHHAYSDSDIQKIVTKYKALNGKNKLVITTEKDYIRIKSFSLHDDFSQLPLVVLPIRVEFVGTEQEEFLKQIEKYVRKNKRNMQLHK